MGETLFVGMLALFWLAEFVFGVVVVGWFVRQGFAGEGRARGDFPLEEWSVTKGSLTIWAAFFVGLVLLIVVGV